MSTQCARILSGIDHGVHGQLTFLAWMCHGICRVSHKEFAVDIFTACMAVWLGRSPSMSKVTNVSP